MRVIKKWVLLFAIGGLLVSWSGSAHANRQLETINQIPTIPDIVARVNGNDIPAKPIKFQFMKVLKNEQGSITPAQKDKIVRKVIDDFVVRELMYQEGQKLNLIVNPKVVEAELQALKSAYKNEDDFKQALLERDITEDDLKRSIEVDAQAKIILEQQVKGKVEINDAAVQKYYKDNKENFLRPMAFRPSHVLIMPFPPEMIQGSNIEDLQARKEELREKAREKILEIQKELKNGVDIAELAKKYSHDESTAENGGDLGFLYAEGVEKAFADAVAKLEVGEVSDVVETKYGFHLIMLTATKPSEYAPFEDMKEAIQEQLFMEGARDRVLDYIDSLRKKAKIEILY